MGVGSLVVFVSARSACCGVTVVLAVLLAVLGSNWSEWVIAAVFVCELGLTTVARITIAGDREIQCSQRLAGD